MMSSIKICEQCICQKLPRFWYYHFLIMHNCFYSPLSYRCVEGYEGDQCETNINDCSNSTCLNGGQCIDSVNNYTCSCTEGWTGRDCSVDVNECRPNPCLQNGICVENITPPGFRYLTKIFSTKAVWKFIRMK